MALVTKPPLQEKKRAMHRIWKTPGSKFNWIYLGISLIMYGYFYKVYLEALKSNPYAGPYSDPLRLFGIVAFILVLIVAAFTLRRRLIRILPGKVQNWLWIHTWFGILAILIAFLHENYLNILHDLQFTRLRFTEGQAGTLALYARLLLVVTGIIGRLLDVWQARVIAKEANSNGVGIIQTVEEQLHKVETFTRRAHLERSLHRQKRARLIIRTWRYIHIPLACLALISISYHSFTELMKMLLYR